MGGSITRRLLLLFGLIFCAASAHATNCPLAAGGNIQSALSSCGSGNTVTLAAGNYTVSSTINVPCGVSLSGPTPVGNGGTQPTYSQTHNQTAIITSTMGIDNWGFVFPNGCSVAQGIQYVEWNGGRPTNGTVSISTNNENPAGAYKGNLNPQCFSGNCGCLLQHAQNGQNWNSNNSNGVPATASSGGGYVSCGEGGGNFVYISSNATQTITISNNYAHGNNCGFLCGDTHAGLIYINNNGSTPANQNVFITWNIMGAVGDCQQANVWSYNQNTEGGGGTCNDVEMGGYLTNIYVQNNTFTDCDDCLKVYEMFDASGPGQLNNGVFQYNNFSRYDRIASEGQANWGGPSRPTLEYLQYNSFDNMIVPKQQDYDISIANGCNYGFNTSGEVFCVNHMDYNMSVQDTNGQEGLVDAGYEYWGGVGSTAIGNFWSGKYLGISIQWDPSGQYTFTDNTVMSPASAGNGGTNSACGLLYANINGAPFTSPTCTGNFNQTSTGTITSVAPVLTVSGNTVTIKNTNVSSPNGSNPGRDSNTTFWCTTDGSTPSAGGGSSVPYWVGAASQTVGSITASGTIRCLGMWGAPNQPHSYVPVSSGGGGYVPSAVVSVTTGPPTTTATPLISPTAETFWPPPVSVSITDSTPGATIHYTTNGTTPTTSSTVYTGPFNISSTSTVQAIATSSGLSNSAVTSTLYTAQPPTIAGCYQHNTSANVNSLAVGGTIQQFVYCQYTGLSDQVCSPTADPNLSVVASWGITGGSSVSVGAVGSSDPGFVTAVSAGNTTLTTATVSQNGGAPITCGEWGWTVTNSPPTLTGVSISLQSGGSGVTIGTPQQACATFIYTGSISDTICGNSADAFGSTANTWTSSSGTASMSSSGVVTGNSAGTAQITVKATNGSTTVGPSTPQTITINTPVTGSNYILSGPQHLSGQVIQ